MSSFVKLTAAGLTAIVLLAGVSAANAAERCEGTLCDIYYGKTSAFDDKPAAQAAPTPVTVPRGTILGMFDGSNARQAAAAAGAPVPSAPGKAPLVGVGGGGIAAMARGERVEQCSGTICDLYYGKSGSFDDEKSPQQATAPASQGSQVATELAPEPVGEPAPAARGFDARPEPARCASKGRDLWSCYR